MALRGEVKRREVWATISPTGGGPTGNGGCAAVVSRGPSSNGGCDADTLLCVWRGGGGGGGGGLS